MDRIINLDISEGELDELIFGLQNVHTKIGANDRVKLEINFGEGKIKAYRYNDRELEFEVEM